MADPRKGFKIVDILISLKLLLIKVYILCFLANRSEGLENIIQDRIHNKKWFTARGLETLSDATGWEKEMLAKIIGCIVFWLLMTHSNWIVCNTILVAVPMLLTYVYPDERPPVDNMRVYWISAFVVTAYDRMLEAFPFYYIEKLCALLSLLVEPSCLNEKLKRLLKISTTVSTETAIHSKEDLETAKTSAWGRFTESLKSAIGAPSAPNPTPKPTTAPRKSGSNIDSPRISEQSAVKTAIPRSTTLSGERSMPVPTPYDTKPVSLTSKPRLASARTSLRAPVAAGPPVGVGEKKTMPSSYINLPKPVGKEKMSLRLEPRPPRRGGTKSGSESRKQKNVSVNAKISK